MTPFDRQVRAQIYRLFVDGVRLVDTETIAASRGWDTGEVENSLTRLAEERRVSLVDDSHQLRMAHPFSGVDTGYRSVVGDTTWNANCAWDALAILALMGDGRAYAPGPGGDLVWTVEDGEVSPDGFVHFLVPAARFWDDIGFT